MENISNPLEIRKKGTILSSGCSGGSPFLYCGGFDQYDEYYELNTTQEVENELRRLDYCLKIVTTELDTLVGKVEKEISEDASQVFTAHKFILMDINLIEDMQREIKEEYVSCGEAIRRAFRRVQRKFEASSTNAITIKTEDLQDLALKLINALSGNVTHPLSEFKEGQVLVAKQLMPSDTIHLSEKKAAGIILETGSKSSHAALFAREASIPTITGIKDACALCENGISEVWIESSQRECIFNPTQETKNELIKISDKFEYESKQRLSESAKGAIAKNGTKIFVGSNIGSPEDTQSALKSGADGIGLLRMEKLYMSFTAPPDTKTLTEAVSKAVMPFKGKPITIRLLDMGADKPLRYLPVNKEGNPALGLRGIRYLIEHTELLHTQLHALMEIHKTCPIRIMIPMVTTIEDVLFVHAMCQEISTEYNFEIPKIGIMIETPRAAIMVQSFLEHIDFISVGTNDLTQYFCAADRENGLTSDYFQDTGDWMFRILKLIVSQGNGIDISICGELAGYPDEIASLLSCGITSLSVAPSLVPVIKQTIRKCDTTGTNSEKTTQKHIQSNDLKMLMEMSEDSITLEDIELCASDELVCKERAIEYPERFYSILVFTLTHKEYPEAKAKKLWHSFISRKKELTRLLSRDPGIVVATADFMTNTEGKTTETVLIESNHIDAMTEEMLRDSLTELYTRSVFDDLLQKQIEDYKRTEQSFGVIMIDVDNFKAINDTHGHQTGDEVLKNISHAIKSGVREMDYVARYGGDEFAVLSPHVEEKELILIQERIKENVTNSSKELNISVSTGASFSSQVDPLTNENILENADKNMYDNKAQSRE